MAHIRLEHVSKTFAQKPAVADVTIEVADGSFFAILGPSGCGKTTTLRLIAGLETADQGHIRIGERDVTRVAPGERRVAMVFQDYALYPHMTVAENVGYALKVRRRPRGEIADAVGEMAQRLGLDSLLTRRPGELSGGEQQRTALARALLQPADALLLDEPLSNLDARLRFEARAALKSLQQELGRTMVYVTHDQAEAMALADRIAVMDEGRVMQVGAPLEVYRRPQSAFVAAFLGGPAMNLLPGRVYPESHVFVLDDADDVVVDIAPLLERTAGRAAHTRTLGIRPEHVTLAARPDDYSIPSEVMVVQSLGAETLVTGRLGRRLVVARLFADADAPPPGRLWLRFDPARLHAFDADGARIDTL
ncbi:MAG: ABC transporter ATP-binding protein [Anaerolineae bacterium]